jgi:hypothetical protein
MTCLCLLRPAEVLERRGDKKSQLYRDIAAGLWPPWIKHGRASVQPEHEVELLLEAIVAGATRDERRQLVQRLIQQRKRGNAMALDSASPTAATVS